MTELILPSLYVELTRSINLQGYNYLSLDHSIVNETTILTVTCRVGSMRCPGLEEI
jgi:hypothetical protein